MRFVGDGCEGTTPMDVDTPQGELRPPTPLRLMLSADSVAVCVAALHWLTF